MGFSDYFKKVPVKLQELHDVFWYDNLTEQQLNALEQATARLRESNGLLQGKDDKHTLLRYLKARQFDVDKAVLMYSNMVKWRREKGLDGAWMETFDFPEAQSIHEQYPHFYHKTDKYGRPVYIELLGRTYATKILEATTVERFVDFHIWEWERFEKQYLPACSQVAGREIIQSTVIVDLNGLSMKNFTSSAQRLIKTFSSIDQDNYCERLGQMFIVNTPSFFKAIWTVVSPMLEERTRKKIIVLGAEYLDVVTQVVPPEHLPTILGGKSPVSDLTVNLGPWSGNPGILDQIHSKSRQLSQQVPGVDVIAATS